MRIILAAALAMGFFAAAIQAAEPAPAAAPPQYLVLPPAGSFGQFTPSQAPRYAYGWFGATQIRPHWTRHFGYYRDQIRWTAR